MLAKSWAVELQKKPLASFASSGIRYRPEPEDALCEEWVDPYIVKERGHGDCDDMVIWRLAEILNANKYNPRDLGAPLPAWPMVARIKGTGSYHVYIRHRNGAQEDPAKDMLKKYGPQPPLKSCSK